MAGKWKSGTLCDLADVIMGQSPSGETTNETGAGLPLLNGPTEFGSHYPQPVQFTTDPRKFAEPNDLLFCVRGSTGRMNWADQRYAIGRGIAAIRPKHGSDLRHFVHAVVDASLSSLLATATGSTFPNVSREQICGVVCLIPPLPEQKAIADILGSLDDKIELNRRTNETLEAMARAVFKSWFVDFDPVHAKSKGRQPDGMDAETASLFPGSFQNSEIGRVPKGWKVKTVSEVAEINGWTLGKNDGLDPIQYIEISEVNRGEISNIQIFERGQEPSRARRRLRHGDTVLSTVRPDRRSYFLCLHPSVNLIASTGFAVLSPTKVSWSFLHAGLTQSDVFDHLGQHADGGAYPAIRPELIGQWRLPLPDNAAILDAFHGVCARLFEKAENNRGQTDVLSQLRDSLLPRLLSGEVAVPVSKVA